MAPECYEKLGTYAQMNPPVRDDRHRQAIWAGLAAGTVDVLGSDHAPHTREEKDHAYPGSHSGMTGVQTLVPIMLDHVNAGRLTIERFVDLTSHGPQRLFGIRGKGRIAAGYDADFTVVDLKREETITARAGGQPRRLDALRRQARQGLARGHLRARPPRHVGRRDRRGRTRRPRRLSRRLLSEPTTADRRNDRSDRGRAVVVARRIVVVVIVVGIAIRRRAYPDRPASRRRAASTTGGGAGARRHHLRRQTA